MAVGDSDGGCRTRRVFGAGLTLGVMVGFAVGSALTMRLGEDTAEALRDLFERVSGRRNRVNFELLLQ